LIEAKIELIAYTNLTTPQPDDYTKAYRMIGSAIDKMRGVYRNVGEDEKHLGYFPYEPLHDMRKELEKLGLANTEEGRARARHAINRAWKAMRYKFLVEFETPEPTRPIVVRNYRSVQKRGISPHRRGVLVETKSSSDEEDDS
jgi:hypothetical protein